jgi:hypothetical protein
MTTYSYVWNFCLSYQTSDGLIIHYSQHSLAKCYSTSYEIRSLNSAFSNLVSCASQVTVLESDLTVQSVQHYATNVVLCSYASTVL